MKYGDNPIRTMAEDLLNRKASVEALAALLHEDALDTPMIVGIQGDWGSGKTSVMQLLMEHLQSAGLCIWFDAWRYGTERLAIWRGLVATLVESVSKALIASGTNAEIVQELTALTDQLYRSLTEVVAGRLQVNWKEAIPWLTGTVARLAGAGPLIDALKVFNLAGAATAAFKELKAEDADKAARFIEREHTEHYKAQIQSVEQFREALREIISDYALKDTPWHRLFLFVDDLDRCLPDVALELIEAIKLFFNFEHCVYVFAMDRRLVAEAVRVRYQELAGPNGILPFDPGDYVDKIVQIPFTLPPLSTGQMKSYVEKWCDIHGRSDIKEHCAGLIAKVTLPNPRGVKRTLNLLHLNSRLWQAGRAQVSSQDLRRLAVITTLQVRFPRVYAETLHTPAQLRELEEATRSNAKADLEKRFVQDQGLTDLFKQEARFDSLNDDELANLLFPGRLQ
jgi:hypothetical protein